MYGFNVTDKTFPYDNRPVAPLTNYTFDQWWFHGHLDYPPNPGDLFGNVRYPLWLAAVGPRSDRVVVAVSGITST